MSVQKPSALFDLAEISLGAPALPIHVESAETGISDAFGKAQKRKEYLKIKARERRARQAAK